jgi:hypothetical protein
MKILLLEDDQSWADRIQAEIKKCIPNATFIHFNSEWSFRSYLESNGTIDFDAAIFDIMVRWASYDEIMEKHALDSVPKEVMDEIDGNKRWRTGIRCRKILAHHAEKHGVHCPKGLFFSVLMPADVVQDLPDMNGSSPLFVKSDGIRGLVESVMAIRTP